MRKLIHERGVLFENTPSLPLETMTVEHSLLWREPIQMCGPFLTTSTTKHKYYVIFVNDYSRKCWVFFMQKKDQTFTKFCDFKALVEKESVKKVKAL